jgi:hypothetical protein
MIYNLSDRTAKAIKEKYSSQKRQSHFGAEGERSRTQQTVQANREPSNYDPSTWNRYNPLRRNGNRQPRAGEGTKGSGKAEGSSTPMDIRVDLKQQASKEGRSKLFT